MSTFSTRQKIFEGIVNDPENFDQPTEMCLDKVANAKLSRVHPEDICWLKECLQCKGSR